MVTQRLPTRDFYHGDWVEWTNENGETGEGMFVKTLAYLLPTDQVCLIRLSKDRYEQVHRSRLNYVPCKHGE